MTIENDIPGKRRDSVADKLSTLMQNLGVLQAMIENPDSLSAKILIKANMESLCADLREKEGSKSSSEAQ